MGKKLLLSVLLLIFLSGCIQPEIKVKKKTAEDLNEIGIPEVNPEDLNKIDELGENWVKADASGIKSAKKIVLVPYYEGKILENLGRMEVTIKKLDVKSNELILEFNSSMLENVSGEISGKLDSYTVMMPYYWRYATETESSFIFLPPDGIKELKEATSSALKFEFVQRMPKWFKEHIEFLGSEILSIYAEPDPVDFEVKIDGKIEKIKAMKCRDSMGNKYILSLDEEFPIILQFEYSNYFRKKTDIDSYLKLQENAGFKVIELYR